MAELTNGLTSEQIAALAQQANELLEQQRRIEELQRQAAEREAQRTQRLAAAKEAPKQTTRDDLADRVRTGEPARVEYYARTNVLGQSTYRVAVRFEIAADTHLTDEQATALEAVEAAEAALSEFESGVDSHPGFSVEQSEQQQAAIERVRAKRSELVETLRSAKDAWQELKPF